MSIRIEAVAYWHACTGKMYRITGIKAKSENELFYEYTSKEPSCYLIGEILKINSYRGVRGINSIPDLFVGLEITSQALESVIDHLNLCGKRLQEINASHKTEKIAWSGKVVFTI